MPRAWLVSEERKSRGGRTPPRLYGDSQTEGEAAPTDLLIHSRIGAAPPG